MERILESTEDFDVELFDDIVSSFYSPGSPKHKKAEEILLAFRDHPDSWARTPAILGESRDAKAKIFALQVLERTIKIRWALLTDEQQNGVREYTVEALLAHALKSKESEESRILVTHLNQALIEIIKREWPEKWPQLISDLIAASQSDLYVCGNTFVLLTSLVDEIFNFSKSLLSSRSRALKAQMLNEMPGIFGIILSVLEKVSVGSFSAPDFLVSSALGLLLKVSRVLPLSFVLGTGLLEVLRRYVESLFSIQALELLTEIASKDGEAAETPETSAAFYQETKSAFLAVTGWIEKYVQRLGDPLKKKYASLQDADQALIRQVVQFYAVTYKNAAKLEKVGCCTLDALDLMLQISEITDFELFRACTEFWHIFVHDLYLEFPFSPAPATQPRGLRREKYAGTLMKLTEVLLQQMARPEEVIVVENDEGEIVLERLSETEQLTHCREMKETLFHISSMISGGLCSFLLNEAKSLSRGRFFRDRVSKVAWAIGAVADSVSRAAEKEFLLHTFKIFLGLSKEMDNDEPGDRAMVASSIMYIVVQNPRFLKDHWRFLVVVMDKLLEFMAEPHKGIKDMACETFLKISKTCSEEFRVVQEGSRLPYAKTLLRTLDEQTRFLKPYQLEMVYESLCYMVEEDVDVLMDPSLAEIKRASSEIECRSHTLKESLVACIQAVRRIRVIFSASTTAVFNTAKEKAATDIFPELRAVHNGLRTVTLADFQGQKYVTGLRREILETFCAAASGFSLGFIHGDFLTICSEIILQPLSLGAPFEPASLELLGRLCSRTVQQTLSMVGAVSVPVSQLIFQDPQGNEELMKAFYNMLCAAVAKAPELESVELLEWLAFGIGQPHRGVSEQCIDALASILGRGESKMAVSMCFFGLLECIVGAALDKDHEGGKDGLLRALSVLTKYSIEEKCATQSEVLEVFGSRLRELFPHLSVADVQEFIIRCYDAATSHEALLENIDDFSIKIKTVI